MFERLLERVLQRSLGKYIEDLDRKQLSVSVWSGQIELENLNLKKNLIEKLRLPVNLLMGKIGKLTIKVPWNQLSSKPIEVFIQSVNVVVTPKGRQEWTDNSDTIGTSEQKRKKFLDTFTQALFNEMIKAKEVIEKEMGMMARMSMRTVDNLQVQIQNLHVRIESNNANFSDDLFSMGITLGLLKINTTNEDWQIEFLDRTQKEQARLPLHKILVIENFGIYYKPKDLYFVGDLETEEQRIAQLNSLFPEGASKIAHYSQAYLLEPVRLVTKLKIEPEQQFRATVALDIENVEICMQKSQLVNILRLIELDQQYTKKQERFQYLKQQEFEANLAELKEELELDDKGVQALFKKLFLARPGVEKIFILKSADQKEDEGAADDQQIVMTTQSEACADELLYFDNYEDAEQYSTILMGVPIETHKEWLTAIGKEKAQDYLNRVSHQQHVADSKKGMRSYFKSFFVTPQQQTEKDAAGKDGAAAATGLEQSQSIVSASSRNRYQTEEDEFEDAVESTEQLGGLAVEDGADSEDEFYDAAENEELLYEQLEQQLTPIDSAESSPTKGQEEEDTTADDEIDSQPAASSGPELSKINADFRLGKFSLTLMYDHVERSGIQILMQEFCIFFKKYDSQQSRCLIAHELRAMNKLFGVYSVDAGNERVAILEQVDALNPTKIAHFQQMANQDEESKEPMINTPEATHEDQVLQMVLIKHNILADTQAKVATSEAANGTVDLSIDMDISVLLQPIKLIYRPVEIERLVNFFVVEDLRPELRVKAQNLKRSLTAKLDSHYKQSIEMHELRKRKNKVRVEVICPVLEVPFSNNPQYSGEQDSVGAPEKLVCEEKWVIAMGDLLLTNFQAGARTNTVREHGDVTQVQTHKNFQLQISNSYFKYQRGALAGERIVEPTQVIGDFNIDLLISVRKRAFESQAVQLPKLRISGKMSDLSVSLTPYTYCNFTQIHKLFMGEQSEVTSGSEDNPLTLFKLSNRAVISGLVVKVAQLQSSEETFLALLHQDELLFYSAADRDDPTAMTQALAEEDEEADKVNAAMDKLFAERGYLIHEGTDDRVPLQTFSLIGCSIMSASQRTLSLGNGQLETCVLSFKSTKQMAAWKEAIESSVKQIQIAAQGRASDVTGSPFETVTEEISSKIGDEKLPTATMTEEAKEAMKNQQNHLILKSIISFEVPSIKVVLSAEKKDLDPEKGVFDPCDAGLFDSKDSAIDSWRLVVDTQSWKIEQIRREDDSDLRVSLEQFQVIEVDERKASSERFPWLLKTNESGFSVDINRITRGTDIYKNVDMTVKFACGALHANWKPKAINRLLRFLRFKNFKRYAFKMWLSQALFRFKQMKLIKKNKENGRQVPAYEASFEQQNTGSAAIRNCETEPQVLMRILVKIDSLQIRCLHPQNDTYPILSACSDNFSFDYNMMFDHDEHSLVMQTLEILDHTQYPNTLDPTVEYAGDAHMEAHKILTRKPMPSKGQNMLEMQILMFHFPMERTCPKAWLDQNKQHDKFVKMQLRCCRLNFIQECLFRLYEYFYSQVLGALSDSNPYQEGRRKADATFRELIILAEKTAAPILNGSRPGGSGGDFEQLDPLTLHPYWTILNAHIFSELQQSPFCTGLDIKFEHPLVILKDRFYKDKGEIQAHFSQVHITAETAKKKGRYRKQPNKMLDTTTMQIRGKGLSILYTQSCAMKQKVFTVMPPTNFVVEKEAVTWSPMLDKQMFLTPGFDFTDLDFAQHFKIKCEPIRLTMVQEIFTYFMQLSDLNINFVDENQKQFQLGIWDDPDSQKFLRLEEETKKKYRDHKIVYKQKIEILIPSLSMVLLSSDDASLEVDASEIAELVFWNFHFEMQKFHDGRKKLDLTSHSLQVLRNVFDQSENISSIVTGSNPESADLGNGTDQRSQRMNLQQRQQQHLSPESTESIREERTVQSNYQSYQLKQVLMGHISTSSIIFANDDFYRFNVDKIIRSDETFGSTNTQSQQSSVSADTPESRRGRLGDDIAKEKRFKRIKNMLLKNNFVMQIDMFPSGEKIYKINLEQPKLVARADIFLMIGDFFRSGFPVYNLDTFDKPNGWTDDPNSSRRQEVVVEMRQALVCLANGDDSSAGNEKTTTVVCSGDIFLTKTRENINQVKLKLLDRMDRTGVSVTPPSGAKARTSRVGVDSSDGMVQQDEEHKGGTSRPSNAFNYDYSTKTNLMLIQLNDFCPYFCSTADLNGKQLKDLKKREIMQPFNVHFNVTNMIELVRVGDAGAMAAEIAQQLVFKKFKRTDVSLDWTLLKLSFHDLQIFKQIFEYNINLVRKRSEKMSLLADEAEATATHDLSNATSSDDSANLSDLVDNEDDPDQSFSRGNRRIRATLGGTFIESPIGPSKDMQQPHALIIHEPSVQDSAASYGDIDDSMSAEEGHVGQTSGKGVSESRRTMRQSQKQSHRQRGTSYQRVGDHKLLEGQLHPVKKTSSQVRKITTGSGSSGGRSRKLRIQRSIQEFTTLDNARDLISNILKPKSSDNLNKQNNSNDRNMSSSSAGSISEHIQKDEPRSQLNAFYFVRRSCLKAEESKANKRRRQSKLDERSKLGFAISGACSDANADEEMNDEDEANAGIEDSDEKRISISKLMHDQREMKTKTQVELTSRGNALRITEEDTDEEQNEQLSEDEPCVDVYNDLRAIGIAQLEKFSDFKVLQVVEEELGQDNLQVVSYGLQFIVINDYSGNYLPVFGISLSELDYQFGLTTNLKEGKTALQLSASYFNAKQGCWEPIVEHFAVEMLYSKQERTETKDVQLNVREELNLNVTESFLQTIRDTYQTIKTQSEEAKAELEAAQQKKQMMMVAQTSRSLDGRGAVNVLSRSLMDFELLDRAEEESKRENDTAADLAKTRGSRRTEVLNSDKDAVISPFAIRNLTESEIIIQKQLTKEELQHMEIIDRRRNNPLSQTVRSAAQTAPLQAIIETGTETVEVDSDGAESIVTTSEASDAYRPASNQLPRRAEGISHILEASAIDSRQRHEMMRQSQHYKTKKKIVEQRQFKTVLKVESCATRDHKINYDLQIEKQIASFKDINVNERLEEIIWVNFGRKSKAPLSQIDLNKSMKPCRHYFRNRNYMEFIVYSIEFENMKRVLTLRTQYLMLNKTMHDYQINIKSLLNTDQQETKLLKAGQSLPIPESYNQCTMQLRPAGENSDTNWSDKWQIYALKKVVEINQPGYLKHGNTYTYFRKELGQAQDTFDICLMPPLMLLNCLPVALNINFLDINGKRQRITLQKEETRNIFDFDLQEKINLTIQLEGDGYSPALLILDMERKIQGEEEKIQLLMKDQALRRLFIRATITTKTAGFKVSFDVANCLINNTEKPLLFFYKEPSHDEQIFEADRDVMVSQPIESPNLNQSQGPTAVASSRDGEQKIEPVVHMLSNTREVFSKLEGSSDVSTPIITFTHGSRGQFSLQQRHKLLEFGYFTNMYRCHATENLYTKITTVQPRYMVINYTQSTLICAQDDMKGNPLIIKSGRSTPFHWNNKNLSKLMSVQIMPRESQYAQSQYDWSCGFSLEQTGSLTLINRQKKEQHFIAQSARIMTERKRQSVLNERSSSLFSFFTPRLTQAEEIEKKKQAERLLPICKASKRLLRINRKLHQQQILVIVEEEEEELPDMRIENKCDNICIVYQQEDNKRQEEVDLIERKESQAFAWSDPAGKKVLVLQFFRNSFQFPSENQLSNGDTNRDRNKALIIEDQSALHKNERFSDHVTVTFDKLNQVKSQIVFARVGPSFKPVYISHVTNGFTRILRFDNVPPMHKTIHSKQLEKEKEILKWNQKVMRFRIEINMVNLSLCTTGKELMTVYFSNIKAFLRKTPQEKHITLDIGSLQIDNQSEQDPVYPVTLVPTELTAAIESPRIPSATPGQDNDWDEIVPEDVFQMRVCMRNDFPNVLYIKDLAFLLQRLDLKMELAHVMRLYEFFKSVSKIFNQNLVTQHKIFQRDAPMLIDYATSSSYLVSLPSAEELKENISIKAQTRVRGRTTLINEQNDWNDQKIQTDGDGDSGEDNDFFMIEQSESVVTNSLQQTTDSGIARKAELDQMFSAVSRSQVQGVDRSQTEKVPRHSHSSKYLAEIQERVQSRQTMVAVLRERKLRKQSRPAVANRRLPAISEEQSRLDMSDFVDQQNEADFNGDHSDNDSEEEIELVKQEYGVKRIYIERFWSSPIAIRVSLMKQGQIENEKALEEIAFLKQLANIGLSVMSLEKTPIYINAFEINNMYGDMADISEQFKVYYKTQLKANTLRLFGGANLIGNPVGFIGTVGSGFKDFYYEPQNGFQKSYREGGYGLAKGTGSLMRNTVGGTIGSLGKVSASIGSALLYLTGDQQFRENRSRQMVKQAPKGVLSGMSSGIGTALDSTLSGIKGVYQRPSEGYRTSGASGMAIGALQGVAGLFVKPVTGAMDLVSKTSQGIEASASNEAQKSESRMRPPRAFYGKEKVIRNFDIDHADLLLSIAPRLRYRLPELPEQKLSLDMNYFKDAWIIEKGTRVYDWSLIVTTCDQLIRINCYASRQAKQLAMAQNDRLEHVFCGKGLVQISSVNSYSQMQAMELYEGHMFDIVFEDNREMFHIYDTKTAEKVNRTLHSLYSDIEKSKQENQLSQQNSLSYNARDSKTMKTSQTSRTPATNTTWNQRR